MKKSNLIASILIIIFMIEIVAILIINSKFYYIIDLTWYYGLILVQVILFVIIKNGIRNRRTLLANIMLLVFIPILFISTLPAYSYDGAKALVDNKYVKEDITFISNEHKLLPISERYSWFLLKYIYHYQVEHAGETLYYGVNPANGNTFQLEEKFFRD